MTDDELEARCERRERLVRAVCEAMDWPYSKRPVWAGLRKVATAQAVVVSLDKLEEILTRLRAASPAP